jgi:hypothetical protein
MAIFNVKLPECMVIFGALGPGTLDLDGDSIVTYWVAGISHHKSTREPGRKK